MKKLFACFIAASIIIAGLLIFATGAEAASVSDVSIKASAYGSARAELSNWNAVYVPGETMELRVTGTPNSMLFLKMKLYENSVYTDTGTAEIVSTNASGKGVKGLTIPQDTKDGRYAICLYDGNVEVYNSSWWNSTFTVTDNIDTSITEIGGADYYTVSSYFISGGLNRAPISPSSRPAYARGEHVTLSYSVNNYRTGDVASGGSGYWAVYNATAMIDNGAFSGGSGTVDYTLPVDYSTTGQHRITINYSDSGGKWKVANTFLFDVQPVQLGISVPSGIIARAPATPLGVSLTTSIPFCTITEVKLQEINRDTGLPLSANVTLQIGTIATDGSGSAQITYILDGTYTENRTYVITAKAQASSGGYSEVVAFTQFTLGSERKSVVAEAKTDKTAYISGESVKVSANLATVPSGPLGTVSYIYTVRRPGGTVLYTNTSKVSQLTYQIPTTFVGTLIADIEMLSDTGIYAMESTSTFTVTYGAVLLNGPVDYKASDAIVINYEIASNVITSPIVTYMVNGNDGVRIADGLIQAAPRSGSFSFTVPASPASAYTISVSAVKDGKAVSGSCTLSAASGCQLTVSFDKQFYAPGDSVKIRYEITSKEAGKAINMPQTLTVMIGQKSQNFVVNSASGEITFALPGNIGDGATGITVMGAGTSASQAISVKKSAALSDMMGTGAFDATVLGLSVVSLILVIVLLLKALGILSFGRERKSYQPPQQSYYSQHTQSQPPQQHAAPSAPVHIPAPLHQQAAPQAAPQTAPQAAAAPVQAAPAPEAPAPSAPAETAATIPDGKHVVRCFKCGADIEITSSERPLIITCPKCGERGMLS